MPYQVYHVVASCAFHVFNQSKHPMPRVSLLALSSPPTYAFSAEKLMAAASKLSSSADGEWEKHFSETFQQESAFFSSILIGRRPSIGPILMDGEG